MLTNLMWMFLLPSIITPMAKLYILRIRKGANLKPYLTETNSDASISFKGNNNGIDGGGERKQNLSTKESGGPLCMEDNIVYIGQDIIDTGKRVSNEQECHEYCEEVSECQVWVYYKERTTCQLKIFHDDLQKEHNNKYASGPKYCSKGINNLSRNETHSQNDYFTLCLFNCHRHKNRIPEFRLIPPPPPPGLPGIPQAAPPKKKGPNGLQDPPTLSATTTEAPTTVSATTTEAPTTVSTTTTEAPTTVSITTTEDTIPSICSTSDSQYFPHQTDCQKFYHCFTGQAPFIQSCPDGTGWSIQLKTCDHGICPKKGSGEGSSSSASGSEEVGSGSGSGSEEDSSVSTSRSGKFNSGSSSGSGEDSSGSEVCEDFGTPPVQGCKCHKEDEEKCFSPNTCISGACRRAIQKR